MTGIILGLILIGGVAFFVMKKKGDTVMETPKTKEEVEVDTYKESINRLFTINLVARKNILEADVLKFLEDTIDGMRNVTEEITKFKNFGEQSVMFSRIGERYLPELIQGYINLSQTERETNSGKIITDLSVLKSEVSLIEASLSSSATQDFEKTGKLISAMFKKFEGDV